MVLVGALSAYFQELDAAQMALRTPPSLTGPSKRSTAGATVGPARCWNGRGMRVTVDATETSGGSGVGTRTDAASGAERISSTPVTGTQAPVTITTPGNGPAAGPALRGRNGIAGRRHGRGRGLDDLVGGR